MRDIIFRGKRKDGGKWVYGYFCKSWEDKHYIFNEVITAVEMQVIEVLPETVGQYTGLKDKNGNMIFEGDIIKFFRWSNSAQASTWQEYPVTFQWGSFYAEYQWYCLTQEPTVEIIGNVHEVKNA